MPLQYPFYSVSFAAATALVITAATQAWRLRREPGGRPLVVTLVGLAFWACCEFAVTLVPGTALAITFMKLWYVGISVVVAGLLAFALEFTGSGQYLTRRTVGALAVWPVVFNLIVWLRTDLVWASFVADPSTGSGWQTTYGIAFGLNTGYSYLLLAAATFLLLRFTLTSRFLYQRQVAVLLAGIVTPWFTDLMYITRTLPYDLTAVGFAVTGITLTWAIQRTKFLDVTPVARDRVIETLSSGVFVLDSEDRLVDSNAAGLDLLDCDPDDIGRPVAELLEPLPVSVGRLEAVVDSPEQQSLQMELAGNHYDITATPLHDNRGYLVGRVILVHDITDQQRQQARLERQNDRLDQFAAVVSHDLRSPLSVASGYVGVAQQTGELAHLEGIEEAHQRMEQLIDELLTFARLDDSDLETTAVDLDACIQSAWEHVSTDDADLVVDTGVEIEANRDHLLQLLENLIRNSVEHGSTSNRTQSGDSIEHGDPSVTIRVTVEPAEPPDTDAPRLRVSDDGTGIPVDKQEAVLEKGYTTGSDGAGLGLAIVAEVAAAHGWTVDIETSDAGGAAFVFEGVEVATRGHESTVN